MDQETLKLRRLFAQYLLAPDSRLHVVRAMDGFQAQFLSNAMHAMRLRSADPDAGYAADGLVKSWTLRGTMHLFAEADLPLFLHDGCRYHSRDWTVPSFWNQRPDWALTPQRQAYFSDLIVDTLTQGPMTREALKVRCRAAGMTEAELPFIVGVDATPPALEAVAQGTLKGTVQNDAAGQAESILDLCCALARGREAASAVELEDGKYVWLEYTAVTAENLEDFLPEE